MELGVLKKSTMVAVFVAVVSLAMMVPARAVAQAGTIYIIGDRVGVGTDSPTEALHVRKSDGTAKIKVEETSATYGNRTMYTLTNNGGIRFAMVNTSNGRIWQVNALGSFNIDYNGHAGNELQVRNNGDVAIGGTLTTTGPTCGAGCDLLFDPENEIESIEDHALLMWDNRYLPAVGPTRKGAPFNLTEKTGGILNELEKAHIYIEQLHQRLKDREARIQELGQRLAQLEESHIELQRFSDRLAWLEARLGLESD